MLYKKYRFYNDGIEIMIPSHFKESESFVAVKNSFASDNRRVIVNIARGGGELTPEQLVTRMDEYYKGFTRDVLEFDCIAINKRQFLGDVFGELKYSSSMMGYQFYNVFLLGVYGGRELIVTMQCVQDEAADNERIFDNIADSIRILKKGQDAED